MTNPDINHSNYHQAVSIKSVPGDPIKTTTSTDAPKQSAQKKTRFNETLIFTPFSELQHTSQQDDSSNQLATSNSIFKSDLSGNTRSSLTPRPILKKRQQDENSTPTRDRFRSNALTDSPEVFSIAKFVPDRSRDSIFPSPSPGPHSPTPLRKNVAKPLTAKSKLDLESADNNTNTPRHMKLRMGDGTTFPNHGNTQTGTDDEPQLLSQEKSSTTNNNQGIKNSSWKQLPFSKNPNSSFSNPPNHSLSNTNNQMISWPPKSLIDDVIIQLESIYDKTFDISQQHDIDKFFICGSAALNYIQNHKEQFLSAPKHKSGNEEVDDTEDFFPPEEWLIRLKIKIYGALYFLMMSKSPSITFRTFLQYAPSFISFSYRDLVESSTVLERFNYSVSENKVQVPGRGSKRRWTSPKKNNKNKKIFKEQPSNTSSNNSSFKPDDGADPALPSNLTSSENTFLTLNSKLVSFIVKCVDIIFSKAVPRTFKQLSEAQETLVKRLQPDAKLFYDHAITQLYEQNLPKVSILLLDTNMTFSNIFLII